VAELLKRAAMVMVWLVLARMEPRITKRNPRWEDFAMPVEITIQDPLFISMIVFYNTYPHT
jgi:hypothetical protein